MIEEKIPNEVLVVEKRKKEVSGEERVTWIVSFFRL
jgi:hypothetical protein